MGETVVEKAHRLLYDGRVTVDVSTEDVLVARVEGDSGTWTVRVDPSESTCTCPANRQGRRLCSHIRAAMLAETFGPLLAAVNRARERSERWGQTLPRPVSAATSRRRRPDRYRPGAGGPRPGSERMGAA